jgi:hypothetical protein
MPPTRHRHPFFVAALLAAWIVPAAAADESGSTVLQNEARLRKELSAAYADQPLGKVLQTLGTETQVTLTASRSVADDKVTLFLAKRPAAEVLGEIARHFDFQWRRNGDGYELMQDLAAQRREASLRERDRAAQLAEIEARLDQVAKLLDTSPAKLEARQADLQTQLGNPALSLEQRDKLRDEWLAIRDALRPGARAGLALLNALSPAQRAALRNGTRIRLTTDDQTLAPAVAELAHAFARHQVLGTGQFLGPAPEGIGQIPAPLSATAIAALVDEPRHLYGEPRHGDHRLRLACSFTSSEGPGRRGVGVIWAPDFDSEGPVPLPPTPTKDPELLRTVRLEPPVPTAAERKSFQELQPLRRMTGSDLPEVITLGEVARSLHLASGLDVVADSFVRARIEPKLLTAQTTPAKLLELLERELEYDWEKEGKLLRLRSKRWHWDRPAEVPDRLLQPWQTRVARTNAPSLDEISDLAAALTDPQLRGLSDYWSWYLPRLLMVNGLYEQRTHLRFWGSLNALQRRAAKAGEIIPTARLNPVQQAALGNGIRSLAEQTGPLDRAPQPLPSPEQVAAGGFSLNMRAGAPRRVYESGDPYRPYRMVRGADADGRMPARIEGPGGIPLQARGGEMQSDRYLFRYHCAGEERPRSAPVMIGRVLPAR